jgi:hypothetical protein
MLDGGTTERGAAARLIPGRRRSRVRSSSRHIPVTCRCSRESCARRLELAAQGRAGTRLLDRRGVAAACGATPQHGDLDLRAAVPRQAVRPLPVRLSRRDACVLPRRALRRGRTAGRLDLRPQGPGLRGALVGADELAQRPAQSLQNGGLDSTSSRPAALNGGSWNAAANRRPASKPSARHSSVRPTRTTLPSPASPWWVRCPTPAAIPSPTASTSPTRRRARVQ